MSVEHSPDHDIAYHFVAYDEHGRERSGQQGLASAQLVAAARQAQQRAAAVRPAQRARVERPECRRLARARR